MTLFLKTCWCVLTVGLLAGPWALANADEHGHDHADHEGHAHSDHDHDHDHAGHDHDHGDHAHDAMATTEAAVETVDDGFANDVDRVSYAIGMDIGGNMQANDLEINPAVLGEAIATAYTQGETRMTPEQAMAVIQRWQQQMQMKQMEAMMKEQEEAAAANTAASEAFFADNKNAEGVQVTESGLQYVITEKGDGPLPGPSDSVTVHYKGQLLDGEVFDSSYDRGSPATFPINGVIPGFGEGLQLMPVGSKGTLFIPGEIAYGMQGGPGGPNAALIFDVEIIATESPAGQEPLPALGD